MTDPAVAADYRQLRPMVERGIAWLTHGNRKLRYRGVANNTAWLHLRVTAITLRRLLTLTPPARQPSPSRPHQTGTTEQTTQRATGLPQPGPATAAGNPADRPPPPTHPGPQPAPATPGTGHSSAGSQPTTATDAPGDALARCGGRGVRDPLRRPAPDLVVR